MSLILGVLHQDLLDPRFFETLGISKWANTSHTNVDAPSRVVNASVTNDARTRLLQDVVFAQLVLNY